MRCSKITLLSFALAVAFSGSADAQNQLSDFPWRAKAKSIAKSVQVHAQKKLRVAPEADLHDVATTESIVTPTPTFDSMPEFFYDQGVKYIRQGDVYVESSMVKNVAVEGARKVTDRFSPTSSIAPSENESVFDKAKTLSTRLNPFSKLFSRNQTAYQSKDWKVPSFSKSLSFFNDKQPADPITFAAITPLPAKTSLPSTIDGPTSIYATNATKSYSPAVNLAQTQVTGGSGSRTALPVPVAAVDRAPVASPFVPSVGVATAREFSPIAGKEVSVFDSAPAKTDRTASLSVSDEFWSPRR